MGAFESSQLTSDDIHRLLGLLNEELSATSVKGEVYDVGGAVTCLAFGARPATQDVNGYFEPSQAIRQAAARVAAGTGAPANWLIEAVSRYLSPQAEFDPFLDLSHLRFFVARREYLLAMKVQSMRLGEEFADLDDVSYLLRSLNVTDVEHALEVVGRYYDESVLLPKTRLALEELLA